MHVKLEAQIHKDKRKPNFEKLKSIHNTTLNIFYLNLCLIIFLINFNIFTMVKLVNPLVNED
jgi:hypothetical protein